ncbi:ABC transporter ATP-binding protein, partial [Candidatus Sumerlaeota bacterium]|nr:ABC transporter ATP-binding protein [Candidatus Sumerlaeota bacterium]
MKSRFTRLFPYLGQNRKPLALGAVALVLSSYLDVKVLVLLGDGIDILGWELGPLSELQTRALAVVLGTIVAAALGGAIARFWMRRLIIGTSRQIEFSLRNDLFAHLQTLSPSFFKRYSTGDIMARSTNDIEAVRLVVGPSLMYLSSTAVMLPMSLFQMYRISGHLTLLSALPLLMIAPLFYFFKRRINVRFTVVQETFSEISTRVQDTLTGIRVIKAHAREDQEAARFDVLSRRFVKENIRLTILQAFFIPLLNVVVGLSLLVMVWRGSVMILREASIPGGLTPGHLISFFVLLLATIWPLAAIGWVFSLLERGAASMKGLDEIFEAEPEVVNGSKPSADAPRMKGRIEIRDLTFVYPGDASGGPGGVKRPALSNVNIDLPAGKTLGLTGRVGSGKSTLALLLARRYNPPRGSIRIDGVDLLDHPLRHYRSQVAIVDQEPFLFSDTVRANIAYGIPEESNGVVDRVSEIAQLADEIQGFPNGLETMLGERGINLSGGQRQRVALARALATD